MGSGVEDDLRKVLTGQPVPIEVIDSQRPEAMQFVPQTKKSLGYIMTSILFNDKGHVLMVQEAKQSCRGSWYLPAGRLEPGENFIEGAQREVMEEAGLECQITTLLSVYFACRWYRMAFTGKITGGKLKTLAEKDEESLQAQFFPVHVIQQKLIPLRALDVLPLIQQAVQYHESLKSVPRHAPLLPALSPHSHLLHRTVIVTQPGDNSTVHILVSSRERDHLPVSAISPQDWSLKVSLHSLLSEAIDRHLQVSPVICGILGVEHCGIGEGRHDGLCLTTLINLDVAQVDHLPQLQDQTFKWVPVTDKELADTLCGGRSGHIVILTEK